MTAKSWFCSHTAIDSSAEQPEVGPALPIAICHENSDAMHRFTEISEPA